MKSITFIQALLIIFLISSECCLAQNGDRVDHVVYMIGNTATSEMNEAQLASLQKHLLTEEGPFTLLHLGDIVKPGSPDNWKSELDQIFKLVDVLPIIYTTWSTLSSFWARQHSEEIRKTAITAWINSMLFILKRYAVWICEL